MIDAAVLARVRNGVCAVGYLSVPLAEYERNSRSPFFQVLGTGFLVRRTTAITNRHVIEGLEDERARLGFPASQLFLSFVVPGPAGVLRNTVRMIRHYAVLGNSAIDVGFLEFHIVHDEHFVDIAPLEIMNSFDLRVSEEIAVYGYPLRNGNAREKPQDLPVGASRPARVDLRNFSVRDVHCP
jgi:hypothetical protein